MKNLITNSFKKLMYSMMNAIRRLLAVASLSVIVFIAQAQPVNNDLVKKESKPYKLLTSGKQITIRSTWNIKHVMLWTTSGYRVVEQKEINNSLFVLDIPVNQKIFFLMIGLNNGKIYTEKIGISEAP
ncbi:MAG: hypothetical protein SGI96_09010 [Bacteroidota bacterium]|nr:hypothetical protein [Chitinophagaceae bacterium]MDZ4808399.1 hypothetical protein [Bacteroidota bacterium]